MRWCAAPRSWLRLVPLLVVACFGVLATGTGTAWAHAEVVATYPSGTVSPQRLTHVSVTFDEAVELIPRALVVTTDLGVPIALDSPRLSKDGLVLRASLQDAVGPGRYSAGWRVRSDDGHIESGNFQFRLTGTSPAGGTAGGRSSTTANPPSMAPGEPVWPVLVAIGLAIAAGLGAAIVVRRGLRALSAPDAEYPREPIITASQDEHAPSPE
jgi:methionine-rich copper-binding protein CopC